IPDGAGRVARIVPWTVRSSPAWVRASYHQMAPWAVQVGGAEAVGAAVDVAVGLLAMMRCAMATSVRRTLVACAWGEFGLATSVTGGPHAGATPNRMMATHAKTRSPRVTA